MVQVKEAIVPCGTDLKKNQKFKNSDHSGLLPFVLYSYLNVIEIIPVSVIFA